MRKALPLCWLIVLLGSETEAGQRSLRIESIPAGARVEHGGTVLGITPIQLDLPTAYFQAPNTVFARYLTSPLKFTLSKEGYVTKTIDLGEGPYRWVSINGMNRFDYYLLRPKYVIKMEAETSGLPIVDQLDALKKLAELRDSGILTESEFDAKKKEVLATAAIVELEPLKLDGNTDPLEFCTSLAPDVFRHERTYHEVVPDPDQDLLDAVSSGVLARCLWLHPINQVASLNMLVQCGISSTYDVCASLPGSTRSDSDSRATCAVQSQDEMTLVVEPNCIVQVRMQAESFVISTVQQSVRASIEGVP